MSSSSVDGRLHFCSPPTLYPRASLIIKYSSHRMSVICLYLVVKYGLSLFKRISKELINVKIAFTLCFSYFIW